MTRVDTSGTSDTSDQIWDAIEVFIHTINGLGSLNPASQTFIALAVCQIAKKDGSRESELVFLTSLAEAELKKALEELDRMHLLRINRSPRLISTSTETRVYVPSHWARGKPGVERITGPRVPSYALELGGESAISDIEGKFDVSIEELLALVRRRVESVDDLTWQEYVRFARIVLSEIRLCSVRVRALYGDLLPHRIYESISILLDAFDEIEFSCETRQSALGLLDKSIRLMRESLAGVERVV